MGKGMGMRTVKGMGMRTGKGITDAIIRKRVLGRVVICLKRELRGGRKTIG
jgi:hypothetical protein